MNESAILDALESIKNGVNTIAGLAIATFVFGVVTLIYVIANYNKS